MSNSSSQLIISLSPDMLCAARTRKRKVVQAEQLELDPKDWTGLWEDGLIKLDQPLRQLISRFPSGKCSSATLIYHSPTITQQVYKFELSASSAREAGVVKIREAVGLRDPIESCVFGQVGKGSESTVTLVYSEREEQLRSLYAWLNRCNVQAKTLIPANIASMNTATQIAQNADLDTAVFYIGSDVSVMAYATDSGVKLIRSVAIGYRKFGESYIQALSPKGLEETGQEEPGSSPEVSHLGSRATELLFEHGIPTRPTQVDGIELQSAVMPMLAPVLQRFCIEIKQTFRFGLEASHMPRNLVICGPGSAIPHLSKAVSQHLDMHIKLDPCVDGFNPMAAFGQGTLENAIVAADAYPAGFLPEIAHDARTNKMLTRGLAAGFMIAALAMGGEYAMNTIEHQEISKRILADSPRLDAVNGFYEQLTTANNMSQIISDVSELVCDTVEGVPQWQVLLANITGNTSESIRMQELRGEFTADGPVVEINGLAVADSEKESGISLDRFINELEALEGVAQVSLGATSRVSVGEDQWGRQFMMRVTLESTPMLHEALVQAKNDQNFGGLP